MGEITAAVLKELSQGIQSVIKDEYKGMSYLDKVNEIRDAAKKLQENINSKGTLGNGMYTTAKDVVDAAAKEASKQFQINDITKKLNKQFTNMKKDADHGHLEDDKFRSQLEQNFQDFEKEVIDLFERYYKIYSEVYTKNDQIYQNVKSNLTVWEADKIMREGYTVINEIAETIRGTSILYEVQLSIGTVKAQKTAFLTLEQIMQYTEVSYYNGATTLKLKPSALRKAAKEGKIQLFGWEDEYRQQFINYTNRVIAIEKTDLRLWDSNAGSDSSTADSDIYINQGNVTESFRAAATKIYDKHLESSLGVTTTEIAAMTDHDIHYMLHKTLQNTGSYWTGPDFYADLTKLFEGLAGDTSGIQDIATQISKNGAVGIQEKVNNATFTNLNSLITQLTQISQLLTNINNLDKSQLNSVLQGNIGDLDGPVEQALIELAKQFLPSG